MQGGSSLDQNEGLNCVYGAAYLQPSQKPRPWASGWRVKRGTICPPPRPIAAATQPAAHCTSWGQVLPPGSCELSRICPRRLSLPTPESLPWRTAPGNLIYYSECFKKKKIKRKIPVCASVSPVVFSKPTLKVNSLDHLRPKGLAKANGSGKWHRVATWSKGRLVVLLMDFSFKDWSFVTNQRKYDPSFPKVHFLVPWLMIVPDQGQRRL